MSEERLVHGHKWSDGDKCDKCGAQPDELWSSVSIKEWLCYMCFHGYEKWSQLFSDVANGRD